VLLLLFCDSGSCRNVEEICTLLGYYAVYSGNCLPTVWDILLVLSSGYKDGDDRLSQNVSTCLLATVQKSVDVIVLLVNCIVVS
jgi:hypothetical protein